MNKINLFIRSNKTIIFSYMSALIIFTAISIARPGFASPNHIRVLIIDSAIVGIIALGQTFVIITGGIDISIPWVVSSSAFFLTMLSSGENNKLVIIIPLILLGTTFIGLINGLGIAYLGISPIIMTLGMNSVLLGGLLGITRGRPGGRTPTSIQFLANSNVAGIPAILILWIIIIIIATVVLKKTAFGRQLYVIGNNETVALFSGTNIRLTKLIAYCLSGFSGGLGGILLAGRVMQSYLGMGDRFLFLSVIVIIVGGASILGGSGQYIGTVAGAFILTIISGILPAFRIPASAQQVIYGVILLMAVVLTRSRESSKI